MKTVFTVDSVTRTTALETIRLSSSFGVKDDERYAPKQGHGSMNLFIDDPQWLDTFEPGRDYEISIMPVNRA